MMNPRLFTFLLAAAFMVSSVLFLHAHTHAQEEKKPAAMTVNGEEVKPFKGRFIVVNNANVRRKPSIRSKRLAKLAKASRISVTGVTKDGDWFVIAQQGKAWGFMERSNLARLIDGSLKDDIRGRTTPSRLKSCNFKISYEGKSEVEGGLFETSDYVVDFTCIIGDDTAKFTTFMFLTEAPFAMSTKEVYQVGLDVPDFLNEGLDPLSATLVFLPKEKKVIFEQLNVEAYAQTPTPNERAAASPRDAVVAAVHLVAAAWNERTWERLVKRGREG